MNSHSTQSTLLRATATVVLLFGVWLSLRSQSPSSALPSFTFVELNCENLFDTRHDSLKQDQEYLPDALRRWTPRRYWRKLDNIGREILSCSSEAIPDLVALCEVENDSVLIDLTRRSLLGNAGYKYLMTSSPDVRGIDVALLYSPFSFVPLHWRSIRVSPVKDMRPTRDILYVSGCVKPADTLHVFVVHAPSRYGGERYSRPFRLRVAETLCKAVDSLQRLCPEAKVVVTGDFNEDAASPSLKRLQRQGLRCLSASATGINGAKGTYRYKGEWNRLDHFLASPILYNNVDTVFINDAPFLLEDETQYGGKRPRRTYNGMRYQQGFSDHLPLVARFCFYR